MHLHHVRRKVVLMSIANKPPGNLGHQGLLCVGGRKCISGKSEIAKPARTVAGEDHWYDEKSGDAIKRTADDRQKEEGGRRMNGINRSRWFTVVLGMVSVMAFAQGVFAQSDQA